MFHCGADCRVPCRCARGSGPASCCDKASFSMPCSASSHVCPDPVLMHAYRTHTCGALRLPDAGRSARLSGWVHRRRDHGQLLFIDLRDHYGITQCVIDVSSPLFQQADGLRLESVVTLGLAHRHRARRLPRRRRGRPDQPGSTRGMDRPRAGGGTPPRYRGRTRTVHRCRARAVGRRGTCALHPGESCNYLWRTHPPGLMPAAA